MRVFLLSEVDLPQSRDIAQDGFVERPERAWIHERLVVEADWQQTVELVDDRQNVELQ